jgi:hypothetical protein
METGARARGLAGWARRRALGEGVSGRWVAAAKVPGVYTGTTAHGASVGAQSASARCAILIGSAAIKIARNSPENNALNFSNRSKRACLCAPFSHVSRATKHQSHFTTPAFLIATGQIIKNRRK